jgi:hypothetical protein
MRLARSATLAVLVALLVGATARFGMSVPVHWSVLMALPAGALTLAAALLSGTHDSDWTAEPEPAATGVTLHATFLTERLERSAIDEYRFTSRVQPRLRRIARAALGDDLNTPSARERLGADLHHLLTSPNVQLPPPKKFAALMRRLEELC